jgi:hypothetical protein
MNPERSQDRGHLADGARAGADAKEVVRKQLLQCVCASGGEEEVGTMSIIDNHLAVILLRVRRVRTNGSSWLAFPSSVISVL